jgi:hypothetical protein
MLTGLHHLVRVPQALHAITATGDLNTGMFFPAADTIAFAEGGAEAMRIDAEVMLIGTTGSNCAKLRQFQKWGAEQCSCYAYWWQCIANVATMNHH